MVGFFVGAFGDDVTYPIPRAWLQLGLKAFVATRGGHWPSIVMKGDWWALTGSNR
jgi:hypothetical protein